jgi:cell division protein FtsB
MMFFNKKLHAKIAALESVVSKQTNTIDQLILDKRSLQRQVTDLHAQRDVLSRRVTPDSSKP